MSEPVKDASNLPEGAPDDPLTGHDYDGIQEYDNPLPSWWKAVFNVTIAFSLFYPFFANSTVDEYNEVAAAEAQRLADELAKLEISDEVIQGIMGQPEVMQVMGKTFQSNCSTCHGKQAEGGAGPNLTDSHWLHGGSLVEIFTVIRNGVPGKEMQPWLETLGPGGVLQMAAYVGSLRDTHVAGGKSPQGKLYEPK